MKILVLKGSGNIHGSSALLADEFMRGAREAGHEVAEFNVARADISGCLGCNACFKLGSCVQKDDNENILKAMIKEADMLVFAMPVYYYGWPAQLKAVIDRFYSYNSELMKMNKKTALLAVAFDDSDEVFSSITSYYKLVANYMHFEIKGIIEGRGCGTLKMTSESKYPELAYELGKSL